MFSPTVITTKTDVATSLKTETLSRPGLNHMPPGRCAASPKYTRNALVLLFSCVFVFTEIINYAVANGPGFGENSTKEYTCSKTEIEFPFGTPLEMNKLVLPKLTNTNTNTHRQRLETV